VSIKVGDLIVVAKNHVKFGAVLDTYPPGLDENGFEIDGCFLTTPQLGPVLLVKIIPEDDLDWTMCGIILCGEKLYKTPMNIYECGSWEMLWERFEE